MLNKKAEMARKIVEHIDRAGDLAQPGTQEHARYVQSALSMEWPVIRALLVDMSSRP